MSMKPSLQLRVSQQLALTPQLQQSIRLLQLSTLEMAQEVEQMLDENPFLELEAEEAEPDPQGLEHDGSLSGPTERFGEATALPESSGPESLPGEAGTEGGEETGLTEPNWEGDGTVEASTDDGDWGSEVPARKGAQDEEGASAIDLASAPVSLPEHLHQQALSLRLGDDERAALYYLIESLDEDGYLADPLPELAEALMAQEDSAQARPRSEEDERAARLEELLQLLRTALHWLQQMEPAGVGARDLAECLRLQILELPNSPLARAALELCAQPLELLARRDIKRLVAQCGLDEALVREALALITRLEPKPGRRFADVRRNIVVPDVIVSAGGDGFKVQLNPEVMPRLRVHDVYAGALRGHKGEAGAGLQQRLQEARWFIKNIQQRFDTILRVSQAIVERQKGFMQHGPIAMKPLVLREIADELGLHESTISRVTTAKYMNTPQGTFELKHFFGSSLSTDAGGNTSSTAVRALIRQFVSAEDAGKPLSDNQLSAMLEEQGIQVARRTVAKYREALKIAPAGLRRQA
jgi:RNA polymerase sigma-54 factor